MKYTVQFAYATDDGAHGIWLSAACGPVVAVRLKLAEFKSEAEAKEAGRALSDALHLPWNL